MTEDYIIHYSQDALNDLREIYSYISNKLLQTENAENQINKIRKGICSLEFMPSRYILVDCEPWHSLKMHQLSIDNFIVFYLVDNEKNTATIVRIIYGGRNIENMISSKE